MSTSENSNSETSNYLILIKTIKSLETNDSFINETLTKLKNKYIESQLHILEKEQEQEQQKENHDKTVNNIKNTINHLKNTVNTIKQLDYLKLQEERDQNRCNICDRRSNSCYCH